MFKKRTRKGNTREFPPTHVAAASVIATAISKEHLRDVRSCLVTYSEALTPLNSFLDFDYSATGCSF